MNPRYAAQHLTHRVGLCETLGERCQIRRRAQAALKRGRQHPHTQSLCQYQLITRLRAGIRLQITCIHQPSYTQPKNGLLQLNRMSARQRHPSLRANLHRAKHDRPGSIHAQHIHRPTHHRIRHHRLATHRPNIAQSVGCRGPTEIEWIIEQWCKKINRL